MRVIKQSTYLAKSHLNHRVLELNHMLLSAEEGVTSFC